jgi:uncharacterized membrane protein YoaT (DUF817 family)
MKRLCIELWTFFYKQAWSCAFAGTLLALMIATTYYYPPGRILPRYDCLLFAALLLQIILIATKMEEMREVFVILLFHIIATAMEIFKTSSAIGSWHYPGGALIHIGNVPLFAGFMYSAVGSYIARVWRTFEFRIGNYPPFWAILAVSLLIYLNFFSHHFIPDIRMPILVIIGFLFWKTKVTFRICFNHRTLPLLAGLVLVSFFIWIAENIATYCKIWLYPHQFDAWHIVPLTKLIAWFLLMFISFTLVSVLHYRELRASPAMREVRKKTKHKENVTCR